MEQAETAMTGVDVDAVRDERESKSQTVMLHRKDYSEDFFKQQNSIPRKFV